MRALWNVRPSLSLYTYRFQIFKSHNRDATAKTRMDEPPPTSAAARVAKAIEEISAFLFTDEGGWCSQDAEIKLSFDMQPGDDGPLSRAVFDLYWEYSEPEMVYVFYVDDEGNHSFVLNQPCRTLSITIYRSDDG